MSLLEILGPPPTDRTWRDEWVSVRAETRWRQGDTDKIDEAWVEANASITRWLEVQMEVVAQLVARGWQLDHAQAYALLLPQSTALGASLRNGTK